MLIQISPVLRNIESLCSLTFGQRVRTVELGANEGKEKFKESQVCDTSVNLTSTIFPIHFKALNNHQQALGLHFKTIMERSKDWVYTVSVQSGSLQRNHPGPVI